MARLGSAADDPNRVADFPYAGVHAPADFAEGDRAQSVEIPGKGGVDDDAGKL
ncbi:hypothetical protein [Pseudonocardia hierapolitana]|uniref:hypothetical protein n=1 Tax=Pseudonocardia hierapolitana TaxID=1128676 RepID=UPI0014787D11|nr:hypothetical protein [Pseudonocardia hierapolitana]